MQNVHLYGVEYIPPHRETRSDHHHHGTLNSHGWQESLDAIREVGRGLSGTAPRKEDKDGQLVSDARVGLFAFCRGMLMFPYLKRRKPVTNAAKVADTISGTVTAVESSDAPEQQYPEQDADEAELAVAIVSDVSEDPFCPIPLHMWTHNVGDGTDSNEWKRFCRILDSFAALIEQLLPQEESPSPAPNSPRPDPWTLNCGGAALAALADALKDSGGKGTLITTRRPNYGAGSPSRPRERGVWGTAISLQTRHGRTAAVHAPAATREASRGLVLEQCRVEGQQGGSVLPAVGRAMRRLACMH